MSDEDEMVVYPVGISRSFFEEADKDEFERVLDLTLIMVRRHILAEFASRPRPTEPVQ